MPVYHARLTVCAMALALGAAGPAAAQFKGPTLLFVHGILGPDLGTGYVHTLPINIEIGSTCLKQTVTFGDVVGPVPVPNGTIPVIVSLANITFPCTNPAIISTKLTLKGDVAAAIVLAESTAGPQAEVFSLTDLNPVPAGSARALVMNAANAGTIDTALTDAAGSSIPVSGVAPGAEGATNIAPFTNYGVTVFPAGTTTPVAGPQSFNADNRSVQVLAVVGSAANSTLTVIRKNLPGNF
jgi:hypothetical protein